ncbi:hypothetical protein [Actinopolymorpha rutila]|nr:hypothetical protein [Actinopolymorpha rutila]
MQPHRSPCVWPTSSSTHRASRWTRRWCWTGRRTGCRPRQPRLAAGWSDGPVTGSVSPASAPGVDAAKQAHRIYGDPVTSSRQLYSFDKLRGADLVLDAEYAGGTAGHTGDDPIQRLLPVGNQGGFRFARSSKREGVKLAVLYTSGRSPDWPDILDEKTGGCGRVDSPPRQSYPGARRSNLRATPYGPRSRSRAQLGARERRISLGIARIDPLWLCHRVSKWPGVTLLNLLDERQWGTSVSAITRGPQIQTSMRTFCRCPLRLSTGGAKVRTSARVQVRPGPVLATALAKGDALRVCSRTRGHVFSRRARARSCAWRATVILDFAAHSGHAVGTPASSKVKPDRVAGLPDLAGFPGNGT